MISAFNADISARFTNASYAVVNFSRAAATFSSLFGCADCAFASSKAVLNAAHVAVVYSASFNPAASISAILLFNAVVSISLRTYTLQTILTSAVSLPFVMVAVNVAVLAASSELSGNVTAPVSALITAASDDSHVTVAASL